jgi:hypothetical protein
MYSNGRATMVLLFNNGCLVDQKVKIHFTYKRNVIFFELKWGRIKVGDGTKE